MQATSSIGQHAVATHVLLKVSIHQEFVGQLQVLSICLSVSQLTDDNGRVHGIDAYSVITL